ncbi:MAG: hypothetical protein JO010_04690 [Alphaproteobacteria bacterium]|nr:hypothetical protein [Alphaproteobacteria bacterium]
MRLHLALIAIGLALCVLHLCRHLGNPTAAGAFERNATIVTTPAPPPRGGPSINWGGQKR